MDKRFSDWYATAAPDESRCSSLEMALAAWQAAQSESALSQVSLFGELQAALERIAELEAAIAASAQDAARYRWLRQQDWFDGALCVLRDPKKVLTTGFGLGADCPSRDRLDAAIDAAIKEPKP